MTSKLFARAFMSSPGASNIFTRESMSSHGDALIMTSANTARSSLPIPLLDPGVGRFHGCSLLSAGPYHTHLTTVDLQPNSLRLSTFTLSSFVHVDCMAISRPTNRTSQARNPSTNYHDTHIHRDSVIRVPLGFEIPTATNIDARDLEHKEEPEY